MLVVAPADRVPAVQALAARWELAATPIGRVTGDGLYRATWGEQLVVAIPAAGLLEACPVYHPSAAEDPAIARLRAARPAPDTPTPSPGAALLRLLDHPPIASKRWVYEQYDSTVQAAAPLRPPGGPGGGRGRRAPLPPAPPAGRPRPH